MHDTPHKRQADALRAQYYAQDHALKTDGRYTDASRKQARARLLVETRRALATLRIEHTGMVAAQTRELERKLFGSDDPDYRLALDAAAQLNTPEELARRLRLSEKTGDDRMASAIMAVAADRGSHGAAVVAQYLERRPDKAALYDRLREHETSENNFQDRLVSPFRVVTPGDLGVRLDNGDLERLAAAAEPAAVGL